MGYLGNENTVTGTQNSKRIVVQATPNQTISTVTGGYTIGQLDVFINGVKLAAADDYSANNGDTVTYTNALNTGQYPNTNDVEDSPANWTVDYLSNGFKVRDSNNELNGSGNTIVYMAWAENPFKTSRAR